MPTFHLYQTQQSISDSVGVLQLDKARALWDSPLSRGTTEGQREMLLGAGQLSLLILRAYIQHCSGRKLSGVAPGSFPGAISPSAARREVGWPAAASTCRWISSGPLLYFNDSPTFKGRKLHIQTETRLSPSFKAWGIWQHCTWALWV